MGGNKCYTTPERMLGGEMIGVDITSPMGFLAVPLPRLQAGWTRRILWRVLWLVRSFEFFSSAEFDGGGCDVEARVEGAKGCDMRVY